MTRRPSQPSCRTCGGLLDSPRARCESQLCRTLRDVKQIRLLWPAAREQLDPRSSVPHRFHEDTDEEAARRAYRDAQERADRFTLARRGLAPIGEHPSPVHDSALDDLAAVEREVLAIADDVLAVLGAEVTAETFARVPYRNAPRLHAVPRTTDSPAPAGRLPRPSDDRLCIHDLDRAVCVYCSGRAAGPVELVLPIERPSRPWAHDAPVLTGQTLDLALRDTTPHRRDPVIAATHWLHRTLPALDDQQLTDTARRISRAIARIRRVVGYVEPQTLLDRPCIACGQMSLRIFYDRRIIVCRNADCDPPEALCGERTPRGEPLWREYDWQWLAGRLGIAIDRYQPDWDEPLVRDPVTEAEWLQLHGWDGHAAAAWEQLHTATDALEEAS